MKNVNIFFIRSFKIQSWVRILEEKTRIQILQLKFLSLIFWKKNIDLMLSDPFAKNYAWPSETEALGSYSKPWIRYRNT